MPRNGMNARTGSGPAEVDGGAVGDLFWRMSQQHPMLARFFAWLGHGVGRAVTAPAALLLWARGRRSDNATVTISAPSKPSPEAQGTKAVQAEGTTHDAAGAAVESKSAVPAPLPPSEMRRQTAEAVHRGRPDGPGPKRVASPQRAR